MLTRFLGRNDTERRIMINAIAPHWDGNMALRRRRFSGFYVAMIPVHRCSSVRSVLTTVPDRGYPLAQHVGSASSSVARAATGDWRALATCCRAPFHVDEYLRLFYTGNFFQLLNPFGLLAGIVSVAMI